MRTSIDFKGHFWLPGAPEKRATGTFTFDQSNGGKLSLIGSFRELQDVFNNVDVNDYARIIGEDLGELYTLDQCLKINEVIGNGQARQDFQVGRVIKGAEYEKGEEILVERLVVEIEDLLEWSCISGIEHQIETYESNERRVNNTIAGTRQPNQSTSIPPGELTLNHTIQTTSRGVRESGFSQDVSARLDFNKQVSIDNALEFASDLQDLIAIATYGRPSFGRIFIHHSGLYREAPDGRKIPVPAELFVEWIISTQDTETGANKTSPPTFNLEDFGGIDGVGRWMSIAEKYRGQLGRVMATRYHGRMTVQDALIGRVAALESFHQIQSGTGKDVHIARRLQELTEHAGDDFARLIGQSEDHDNISAWRTHARNLRNEVAHQSSRVFQRKTVEVYYVSQGAYWLFILCILKEAGAPREVFDSLLSSQQFRLDSRGLQALLLDISPISD
jgi:hypothetical protein